MRTVRRPAEPIDFEDVVIVDGAPVDSTYAEKEMRLLAESLQFWEGPGTGRTYWVAANVGLFHTRQEPPLVPDVFLSLDPKTDPNPWPAWGRPSKRYQTYFYEVQGKPPELVIEIVSEEEGGETTRKFKQYAEWDVRYYIIHDPLMTLLRGRTLALYELRRGSYAEMKTKWLEDVGLGVTLWRGEYENMDFEWLRWVDKRGRMIPTGQEYGQQARQRTRQARQRAQGERERSNRLAAKLRELGIDPDQ